MTFKRLIICLFVCIMCFGFISGCSSSKIDAPGKNEAVVGNGGFAVRKGDYLYFTNGFVSKNDITLDNRNDAYVKGALYVTKLVAGQLQVNEDGVLTDYHIITTKIVGFENSQLYIFDDYLYFLTPDTNKTKEGELDTTISVFYRIKLDKSKDMQKIASTKGGGSEYQFEFYYKDSKTYLLLYEDSQLYRVSCDSKKVGKKELVAKDVTSATMPSQKNYPEQSNLYDKIYFTCNLTEDDQKSYEGGNKLLSYNIATDKISDPLRIGQYTYAVVEVKNNHLYFTRKDNNDTIPYLYRVRLSEIASNATPEQLGHLQYSAYYIFTHDTDGCNKILAQTSGGAFHLITPGQIMPTVVLADCKEILYINQIYVYYLTDANLVVYNVLNGETTNYLDLSEVSILNKTTNSSIKISVDADLRYLFFYVKLTNENGESYYLHRLDMYNDADGKYTAQFLGVYAEKDIPDEEEV